MHHVTVTPNLLWKAFWGHGSFGLDEREREAGTSSVEALEMTRS